MPVLAYVEHCLPGATERERVRLAARHDLALEVAWRDGLDVGALAGDVAVVTLQAYGMHEAHPLHPDPARREQGARHLRGAIEAAARHRIPRVLGVCGFGSEVCARPFESCRSFFADVVPLAREHGVSLLIEPLSPLRAAAMTDPADVARLIAALDAPDVCAALLDTGHLLDGGRDPCAVLATWPTPLAELQLRGPGSTPPAMDVPLAALLRASCAAPPHGRLDRPAAPGPAPGRGPVRRRAAPGVVCVEHRTPIAQQDLARLVAHLRRELAAFDAQRDGREG